MSKELILLAGSSPMTSSTDSVGMAAAEAEVKGAIVLARQFPRDENRAYIALAQACERPTFAASARYDYTRGDKLIDGLSVGFAREAARVWGNMQHGIRIVGVRNDQEYPPHGEVHIKGWAWDMQSNTRVEQETTFPYLIFRRSGGWVKPDERDARELVARHGAIVVRNCILNLLPPDLKDDLLERLRDTGAGKAAKDLDSDREGTTAKLVNAFGGLGVTTDMLCHLLELDTLDALGGRGLDRLRGVFQAIKDGATQANAVFPELGGQAAAAGGQSAAAEAAEAALEEADEEDGDGPEAEQEAEDEPEPEPKPVAASPKKRTRKKATKAAATEDVAPPEPEIRVADDGSWVGDLPKVSDLPAVLAQLEEATVVGMYEREERPGALPHYYSVLEERFGYDMSE